MEYSSFRLLTNENLKTVFYYVSKFSIMEVRDKMPYFNRKVIAIYLAFIMRKCYNRNG